MGMQRTDFQRSRVYSAEQTVRRMLDRSAQFPTVEMYGSQISLPVERKFGSVEAVDGYVTAVCRLRQIQEAWPNALAVPTVRERRGQTKAHYEASTATIAIPPRDGDRAWALRELVVLHELAHHLDPGNGHGPTFATTFLDLVGEVMGPEAAFLLRTAMHECGVALG